MKVPSDRFRSSHRLPAGRFAGAIVSGFQKFAALDDVDKAPRPRRRARFGKRIQFLGFVLLVTLAATAEEPARTDDGAANAALLNQEFQELDRDRSGGVSWEERLAGLSEDQRPDARREFLAMDFDANGELSPAEFQALKRVAVPDPWAEDAERTVATLLAILKAADNNGDGRNSRLEWPQVVLKEQLPPFHELNFRAWDTDKNDHVDEAEARRRVDLAYGVTLPSGEPAHWNDGSVLAWSQLREIDRNVDYIVTREEFVARLSNSRDENAALFAELDRDGDGRLTYAEYAVPSSPLRVNLVRTFLERDADGDGRLTADELLARDQPAAPAVASGFGAFDRDGDGKYSLAEFCRSPFGGLSVTAPFLQRKDSDKDGTISWKEFYGFPKPSYIGVAWDVFHRFDGDGDGQLSHDEYEFAIDPELVQLIAQMTPQVRPALVTELGYFLSLCPLSDEQRQKLKPVAQQMLGSAARKMATGQWQMNREFDPDHPPEYPDPQKLFCERLVRFAQEHLPAEVAANYRREVERREAQRREAAVLSLVTRLDRDLLLDEDQRQKISESLLAKWQSAWGQQIEIVLQNDQFMLQLPDNCILPHLNKRQRTIWQGLPKSGGVFGWNAGGMFGFMDESEVDDDVKALLPPVEPAAAPAADGVGINVIITN